MFNICNFIDYFNCNAWFWLQFVLTLLSHWSFKRARAHANFMPCWQQKFELPELACLLFFSWLKSIHNSYQYQFKLIKSLKFLHVSIITAIFFFIFLQTQRLRLFMREKFELFKLLLKVRYNIVFSRSYNPLTLYWLQKFKTEIEIWYKTILISTEVSEL